MPTLRMPDGTNLEVPDNPSPELVHRIRNAVNKQVGDISMKQTLNPTPGDILTGKTGSAAVTPEQQQKLQNASILQRTMGNIGAGANRVVTGAKQLMGEQESPLEAARRQNQEQAMAKSIPGGGAMQLGGEAAMSAPLAAIPVTAGAGGLGGLIGTGAGLAAQGGIMGALQPAQTPQEHFKNMAVGAAMGPVVGAAAGTAGKVIGKLAEYTGIGARRAAASGVVKSLGDDAPAIAQALRDSPKTTDIGTKPTASQVTGDPRLQGMEFSSRTTPGQGQDWYAHDVANNSARNKFFNDVVGDPVANLAKAISDRNTAAQKFQSAAVDEIDKQSSNMARGLGKDVSAALTGIEAQPGNSEGVAILKDIQNKLAKGPVSAQDVAKMRTNLGDATQADPGIRAAKDAIDGVMAARSKVPGQDNLWDTYLQKFQDASKPVNEAQALVNIKGSHVDPNTNIPVRAFGDPNTPLISGNALASALKQHATDPMYGTSNLSPSMENALGSLAGEQRASSLWSQVPAQSATSSDPAADLAIGAVKAKLGPFGAAVAKLLPGTNTQKSLANLLRDPNKLGKAMQDVMPSDTGTTLSSLLRQGVTQGGTDLMTTPSPTYGAGVLNQ